MTTSTPVCVCQYFKGTVIWTEDKSGAGWFHATGIQGVSDELAVLK